MPVGSSATGAVSNSLPKWQLALIVGAPVALGLGYMYYKNTNQSKSSKGNKGKKSNGSVGDKQISIDGETKIVSESETLTRNAQKYKSQGNQAFGAKKYDEAIRYYNLAIENYPADEKDELAKTYQNRAAAYEALEKYNEVKEDCTHALQLNPTYVKALLRRARIMEKTNDLEGALEDVTAACVLEKFMNQSTLLMADSILKQLGKQHTREYLKNRTPLMPSKHFIKTYFRSFKNDPILNDSSQDGDVNTGLARALKAFTDQKYDDIISICTNELDQYDADDLSDKMKLHLMRGTFYILLGQREKAIDDLDTVISNEEADKDVRVNALIKRATMFTRIENPENCLADFDKAILINAECGDIYHHRGQVNLLMDKFDEARADSETALKLNPNFGITFAQKCYTDYRYQVTRSSTAVESAKADFNRAIELFPDCCECYTLYAQMLCDSKLYEKADEYFGKAIEKDPMNATIYVHRGLLQLQWTGNVEKATDYIKKALEHDDKCEFGYETLGTIEVQRGNLTKAIELFDKALALARTALELTHIFSLRDAAKAQLKVIQRLPAESLMNKGMLQ